MIIKNLEQVRVGGKLVITHEVTKIKTVTCVEEMDGQGLRLWVIETNDLFIENCIL